MDWIRGQDFAPFAFISPAKLPGIQSISAGANERLHSTALNQRSTCGSRPPPSAGDVIYYSTQNRLEWHNGSAWWTSSGSPQPATLFSSCNAIKLAGITTSGTDTIDPANNGTGFSVYCDMTTDGGGWTLAAQSANSANYFHPGTTAASGGIETLDSGSSKLSDANINALLGSATYMEYVHINTSSACYIKKLVQFI